MNDSTLQPGCQLKGGEYRIEKVRGQGSTGITYEAEQVSLGRRVAVKEFFLTDLCTRNEGTSQVSVSSAENKELVEKIRQKFIREVKVLACLDHEHIAKIHDVFEENGTAYYVMENLDGGSLDRKIRQNGAMQEREASSYIRQIAGALKYLHSKNILHFDVKPSNILTGKDGCAKLIDFGILRHNEETGEQAVNAPIAVSKGFAPLEQYGDIDKKHFTPATDIYSLGATYYALITGNTPPEAPALKDGFTERPEQISDEAWNVIEKSMSARPEDRPQNIDEFVSLLGKLSKRKKLFIAVPIALAAVIVAVLALLPEKTTGVHNDHEWVDLGLSVKWATCNVGADSPGDYGSYFAWGETSPKEIYSWDNLQYHVSGATKDDIKFSKYVSNSQYGDIDDKKILDLSDDAASVSWGGEWRMPTIDELMELMSGCVWTWTVQDGHNGYLVTSKKNGNSIFLPAAGARVDDGLRHNSIYGGYWSSSLTEKNSYFADNVFFREGSIGEGAYFRNLGRSIRPVLK